MAAKLPKAYFPGCIAAIYYRKVDKWAERHAKTGIQPYFNTWKEAHTYMLETTTKKIKRLEKDLASQRRHLAKVQAMNEPEAVPPTAEEKSHKTSPLLEALDVLLR